MPKYQLSCDFQNVSSNSVRLTPRLHLSKGNKLDGRFINNFSVSLRTRSDPDWVVHWNRIEVVTRLIQGSNIDTYTYRREGAFYKNTIYPFDSKVDAPYIETGVVPVIEITDAQQMFDGFAINILFSFTDLTFDGTITAEKPYNITCYTKKIYEDIHVDYNLQSDNEVYYEVLQSGKTIISRRKINSKRITIPKGTLQSTSDLTVRLFTRYTYETYNKHYVDSEVVSYIVSGLQALEVDRPTNLRIVGEERAIEENLLFAWDTGDTTNVVSTLQIWQDGKMLHEKTGITGTSYTLPHSTLKSTNNITVRVRNIKNYNGYQAQTDFIELSVFDLKTIMPVITDFNLNANNVDNIITIIPNAQRATSYRWASQGKSVNGLAINKYTLSHGTHAIELTAFNRTSDNRSLSVKMTKQFTLTRNEPIIYSLEPSNININVDGQSTVSFAVNQYFTRYELHVNGAYYTKSNTLDAINIPPNTFNKDTNTLTLFVEYLEGGSLRQTSRTVTFNGYGKPVAPILDTQTIYNSATPTFTWTYNKSDSNTQVAFEVVIVKRDTLEEVERKIVIGSVASYRASIPLVNKTKYRLSISIKNKYDLWSDFATKDFETNFNSLPIPTLRLVNIPNGITVTVDVLQTTTFREVKIYRNDEITKKWVCIANNLNADETIIDYVPQPNTTNYYRARVYDTHGGFAESMIYKIDHTLRFYNIVSVLDFANNLQIKSAIAQFTPVTHIVKKVFAGTRKPTIFRGNTKYLEGSVQCTLTNREVTELETLLNRYELFCYRDWRGRKLYCLIELENIDYVEAKLNNVSLKITEVGFREDNMFSGGGYKKIVYLNGEYMLDGSIDMSGYDHDYKRVVTYNAELR